MVGEKAASELAKQNFTVVVLIISALALILALIGKIEGVFSLEVWVRVILFVISAAGVITAFYWEYRERTVKKSPDSIASSPSAAITIPQPNDIFKKINEGVEPFSQRAAGFNSITLVAKTAFNWIADNEQFLRQHLNRRGTLRLVVIDPECPASRHMYGSAEAIAAANLEHSNRLMLTLCRDYPNMVELYYIKYVPSMSIMVFGEKNETGSFIQVQLYMMHAAIGSTRPIFFVPKSDPWYDVFSQEVSDQISKSGVRIKV